MPPVSNDQGNFVIYSKICVRNDLLCAIKLFSLTYLFTYLSHCIGFVLVLGGQLRQVYKYAFYRVCKDVPVEVVAHGNASTDSAAGRRHVTISLRANQLDTEVVYQTMVMFRQQRKGAGAVGGGGRGCWMSVDLRENRISHLLDANAVTALTRYGKRCSYYN